MNNPDNDPLAAWPPEPPATHESTYAPIHESTYHTAASRYEENSYSAVSTVDSRSLAIWREGPRTRAGV